jgi:hypothetical protein
MVLPQWQRPSFTPIQNNWQSNAIYWQKARIKSKTSMAQTASQLAVCAKGLNQNVKPVPLSPITFWPCWVHIPFLLLQFPLTAQQHYLFFDNVKHCTGLFLSCPSMFLGTMYNAFGKSLRTYKRCLKWCPQVSVQAWTRLILFANTFCRSACEMFLMYTVIAVCNSLSVRRRSRYAANQIYVM